jgi:hypothetical protein
LANFFAKCFIFALEYLQYMRKVKIIFLICMIAAAVFNLCKAYIQAIGQLQDRTTVPLHSLGYQFMGLENVFKGIRTIGYYTDKDLNKPLAIAQFEQAQYVLAPTVLDLNNTQYHWVIFDCTSPQVAIDAIKRLGFVPSKMRNGIILALNPNGI